MKHSRRESMLLVVPVEVIFLGLFSCLGAIPLRAQTGFRGIADELVTSSGSSASARQTAANAGGPSVGTDRIPRGAILPVVLRSALCFDKARPGQVLHGEIAQDVPFGSSAGIHKGARVEGHALEATPSGNGSATTVKIQFDKVNVGGQWMPVVTDLRAIAGFMTVIEAGIPVEAPAEGSPYNWLPKEQIGGDTAYGVGGPVRSADGSKVIGKFLGDGVLGQASAKEGTPCRGPLDHNNNPQALWVFSSAACGIYGIKHLEIQHAGRTDPVGTIVLASHVRNLKLRDGDGLLLRVN